MQEMIIIIRWITAIGFSIATTIPIVTGELDEILITKPSDLQLCPNGHTQLQLVPVIDGSLPIHTSLLPDRDPGRPLVTAIEQFRAVSFGSDSSLGGPTCQVVCSRCGFHFFEPLGRVETQKGRWLLQSVDPDAYKPRSLYLAVRKFGILAESISCKSFYSQLLDNGQSVRERITLVFVEKHSEAVSAILEIWMQEFSKSRSQSYDGIFVKGELGEGLLFEVYQGKGVAELSELTIQVWPSWMGEEFSLQKGIVKLKNNE